MKVKKEFFYDEVRDGFYIPGIIKRDWATALMILSEIDRICRKYSISYFVGGGTLLGAVRDGQFIPWDDDIDIMMKREEYERFNQVAPGELPNGLSLHSIELDKNHCDFISVVAKSEGSFHSGLLRKYCDFPYPEQVDLFVLDELAKNPEEEAYRQQVLRIFKAIIDGADQKSGQPDFQKELDKVEELFQIKLDRYGNLKAQVYQLMDRIFCEFNGKGGDQLACIPWHTFQQECSYPKQAFATTKHLSFCNMQVPVPGDYDAVLRAEYGDYRKKLKAGGAHNYPYYKRFDKALQEAGNGKWIIEYHISEADLGHEEVQNFRSLSMQMADSFMKSQKKIWEDYQKEDFFACLSGLSATQEEAIGFGTVLEQKKGQGLQSISILEKYCEALFDAYQLMVDYLSVEGAVKTQAVSLASLEDKLKKLTLYLDELQVSLKKELKKEVVFLPHSAKHFDSIRPLVDTLLQDEEIDCKIIPIPYYDKCGDGRVKEIHYEGENFPKKYEIVDYNCYDFSTELPDCIVINSPYDEFNQVWTVDPFFYSKEMKKYTNKLVYIPWFVTDEINPQDEEDGKAFVNMEYYVTVPGLFHSDLTIVQSEGMKKAYLAKIEEFAGKDVAKMMEKKIAGAGSCLLGEKERQGVQSVVDCFRSFLLNEKIREN